MKNCVPDWYKNYNLQNWMNGKKSYLVEWKENNGEHHLYQVYATSELDAVKWCAWMHTINCEIVSVCEEV